VRGTHLNRATCPYVDPATFAPLTERGGFEKFLKWIASKPVPALPFMAFLEAGTALRHRK
jgi:hypothetical protein